MWTGSVKNSKNMTEQIMHAINHWCDWLCIGYAWRFLHNAPEMKGTCPSQLNLWRKPQCRNESC